jgi:hypothetical protein
VPRATLYSNSIVYGQANIAYATELCLQVHVKSQNHFTIEEKSSQRGWQGATAAHTYGK